MIRCSCPRQDAERPMSFLLLSCATIVNLPLIKIPENATYVTLGEYLEILQYDTTMDDSHTLLRIEVLNYSPRFSNVENRTESRVCALRSDVPAPSSGCWKTDVVQLLWTGDWEKFQEIMQHINTSRTFWKSPVWYYHGWVSHSTLDLSP